MTSCYHGSMILWRYIPSPAGIGYAERHEELVLHTFVKYCRLSKI